MASMSGWILSMKVLLISAGVVSLAMGLKVSVPVAVNGIPAIWSCIVSWLKPPYLYIIINGIIITIAASSRFHHGQSEPPAPRPGNLISVKTLPPSSFVSLSPQLDVSSAVEEATATATAEVEEATATAEVVVTEIEDPVVELAPVVVNGSKVDIETEEIVVETEGEDVFSDSTLPQERISPELQFESLLQAREKPLVSSRFGHRKPVRTIPEVQGARALRVARPKKHETLESTWKMITEGRHVPLTRHLKKSDAFEHHADGAVDQVPKSETFKDRSNYESPLAKIRKDPSMSQEELNRRVEAFIKKFNEEMRIQRQESLKQYMEMINRGV